MLKDFRCTVTTELTCLFDIRTDSRQSTCTTLQVSEKYLPGTV